jgi:hypothetical protein
MLRPAPSERHLQNPIPRLGLEHARRTPVT